jgi:hypothetical protein
MIGSNHGLWEIASATPLPHQARAVTALVALALACGGVSVLLAILRARDCGRATPVVESIMLAGMLDVHLSSLGVIPAPAWSLMLVVCAIGTAMLDRLRRHRGGDSSRDQLHAVGMLLGAVFLLFLGASTGHAHTGGATAAAASHGHGALATSTIVVVASVAVAAYGCCVGRALLLRRPRRVESVRRLTSLGGLVAMAVMTAVPIIG